MGFISILAQIERKFAWSFLGFLLAVFFGGIAIYTEYFRDTSPIIKYEVLSNTKILDVKEDVGGLSIIYNNEDIKKSKKTLSVLALKIGNEGRSAVLKSYYDNASPLGFVINSGEIIKGEIIGATTPYLQENAKVKVQNERTAEFSDVIIEPNESFVAKFLVLNPENTNLIVSPKGKVAGVKKIILADQLTEQEKHESFILKVISGSIWVQIVRVSIYFLGVILALIIVFGPVIYISDKRDERRKGKILRQFQKYTNNKYNLLNIKVYEFYRQNGLQGLLEMKKAITDDDKFSTFLKRYDKAGVDYEKLDDRLKYRWVQTYGGRLRVPPAEILRNLIDLGIISKEGEKFCRKEENVKAMNEFIDFAVIKRA
jgi:hypothetical protein